MNGLATGARARPVTSADDLAVAGDAVGAIRVHDVPSRTACDGVKGPVLAVHDVAARPAEQPVASAATDQDVVAAKPRQQVGTAEPA